MNASKKRRAKAPVTMTPFVSVDSVVEDINGHLVCFVPLSAGGADLRHCSRGLSDIEGDLLKIVIPTWLAETLAISVGMRLTIDNAEGRLNMTPK
jgi:hypothetical protein